MFLFYLPCPNTEEFLLPASSHEKSHPLYSENGSIFFKFIFLTAYHSHFFPDRRIPIMRLRIDILLFNFICNCCNNFKFTYDLLQI